MKDSDKEEGKELIDLDENGKAEEKNENKKDKSSQIYKYIIFAIILILLLGFVFFFCFNKKAKRTAFDKTKLKNLNLKNRLFYGAVHDSNFKDGKFSEKAFKNIENLANTGVSFIITGGAIVGDIDKTLIKGTPLLRIDKEEYLEEFKKLSSHSHKHNLYIILQLGSLGLMSGEDIIYSPSVNKALFEDRYSVEMTKEDIIRVENDYVQAAIRAQKAGFDGVQIQTGHFGLLAVFLYPQYNRRTDEYGGNAENRARFLIEIIKKVREAVGNDFLISIKIDSEGLNDTVDKEGFFIVSKMAEEAGADIIEVSGNNYRERKDEDLLYYEATKKLAEMLKIPVALIGGVKTLEHIKYALEDSKIEYIGIVRALMKDRNLIKKWENE